MLFPLEAIQTTVSPLKQPRAHRVTVNISPAVGPVGLCLGAYRDIFPSLSERAHMVRRFSLRPVETAEANANVSGLTLPLG